MTTRFRGLVAAVIGLVGPGGLALASPLAAQQAPAADSAQYARGRQVVETVCSTCHSMHGPPKAAPPFRMVVMHYRRHAGDSATAVQRITDWIASPSAERSLLPPMMRQRWGVMPPLPLAEEQRRAAAVYLLATSPGRAGRFTGQVESPSRE